MGVLVQQFHTLLQKQGATGKRVAEARKLDQQSRKAFAAGNHQQAKLLLEEAIGLLGSGQALVSDVVPTASFLEIKPVLVNPQHRVNQQTFDSPFGLFGPYELFIDGHESLPHERIDQSFSGVVPGVSPANSGSEKMDRLVCQFQNLLAGEKNRGRDVTEVEKLDTMSREALADGRADEARYLLEKAVQKLSAHAPPAPAVSPLHPGSANSRTPVVSKQDINQYLTDLQVPWVQEMVFNINELPGAVNVYSRVGREGGLTPPGNDLDSYARALRKFIVTSRHRVKYYEADTEPSGFPPPVGWQGYPEQYAAFLRTTYQTIKEECPDCQVVLGGMVGVGPADEGMVDRKSQHLQFLRTILAHGAGRYFDVFSFKQHHNMAVDYRSIGARMAAYRAIFADYNIELDTIPVFLETAAYNGTPGYPDGNPLSFITLSPQSEREQAAALVKLYIYALSLGIDKIFWNGVVERHDFGGFKGNPFNFYGLVNNPKNDGESHQKLAYYTYQKMIETFASADWQGMKTVRDDKNICMYSIPLKLPLHSRSGGKKKNKKIWVVWSDTGQQKAVTIGAIQSSRVRISSSVPLYDSGAEVASLQKAQKRQKRFYLKEVRVHKRSITVQAGAVPLYIEEL